ncbi:hypothetical protein SAMN05216337_10509 [Bradyrhizobium brasilense]|uniref:Uncharacterized protein n=1 Tax=Bradyrhizobium brasilense TaxID=1419277 RepID=A0A1G7JU22_9BRAD|nr:hypothetical protein [Bradyrhizobium elkanii]SDF28284.1 hypothetical protein SAMN05216337_10509 [Bradyrhizobium brasilense]
MALASYVTQAGALPGCLPPTPTDYPRPMMMEQ